MAEIKSGIDVSYAQGEIDWDAVHASGAIEFAILRAGYGRESSQVDRQFERNYAACQRLGIPVGAYWYSYATSAEEAKREAQVCLQTIQGKQFAYPIAFDVEEQKGLPAADALCKAFCDTLEAAGYYAAIYTFKSALETYLSEEIKSRYDIFLSHVGVTKSSYTGSYGLWQYSWTGTIAGISGNVDLDYAYQDYPSIIRKAGLNGFGKDHSDSNSTTTMNSESSTPEDSNASATTATSEGTLKQILEHVTSIDEKLS